MTCKIQSKTSVKRKDNRQGLQVTRDSQQLAELSGYLARLRRAWTFFGWMAAKEAVGEVGVEEENTGKQPAKKSVRLFFRSRSELEEREEEEGAEQEKKEEVILEEAELGMADSGEALAEGIDSVEEDEQEKREIEGKYSVEEDEEE